MAEGSVSPSPQAGRGQGGGVGSIYDLGYRSYEGVRLGRAHAIRTLFIYSLLSIWGIGRSWLAKLFPWGLAVIALLPALILVGVAALFPEEFEFFEAHEYVGFIQIILALICAVAAPDLIGRDQRNHTLSLYFSRALSRFDYATAKLAALIVSLFLVIYVPQIFAQSGNAVAAQSFTDYLGDNGDLAPPIIASSAVVAVFMAATSLAISVQATRRAFATGAVIATFVILSAIGGILLETLDGDAQKYALLISPFAVSEGAALWIFGETFFNEDFREAGLGGQYYFLATLAYSAVALGVYYRRIQRMAV